MKKNKKIQNIIMQTIFLKKLKMLYVLRDYSGISSHTSNHNYTNKHYLSQI